MFEITEDRIAGNIRRMSTRELLDRATAYRAGMRPEAIAMIEQELDQRGVARSAVEAHDAAVSETAIWDAQGCAHRCSKCERPAVVRCWDWHRLYGALPIFPARYYFCATHSPLEENGDDADDEERR